MAESLQRTGRWLVWRFGRPLTIASWAVVGGGVVERSAIAWHQVTRGELPPEVDPAALLADRMTEAGIDDAVGLLTGVGLEHYVDESAAQDGVEARCVVTVGLGNALRVGDPPSPAPQVGTINCCCRISVPLATTALLEALALVAEARTAALLAVGVSSTASGAPATGTGTDCLAVAAPIRADGMTYAGKHTALGHVIGAAAERAVRTGAAAWVARWRR